MNYAPIIDESRGMLAQQCCATGITKETLLKYLTAAPVTITDDGHWHSDGTWAWTNELIEHIHAHDTCVPGAMARHIADAHRQRSSIPAH